MRVQSEQQSRRAGRLLEPGCAARARRVPRARLAQRARLAPREPPVRRDRWVLQRHPGSHGPARAPMGRPATPTGATGAIGIQWQGAWSDVTTYAANDAVSYNGASYISILAGNLNKIPTRWLAGASSRSKARQEPRARLAQRARRAPREPPGLRDRRVCRASRESRARRAPMGRSERPERQARSGFSGRARGAARRHTPQTTECRSAGRATSAFRTPI